VTLSAKSSFQIGYAQNIPGKGLSTLCHWEGMILFEKAPVNSLAKRRG
jgi:hypothetical protein